MVPLDKKNFTLLSSLFAYPAHPWLDIDELRQLVNESKYLLIRDHVQVFLDSIKERSLEQLAEQYVMTFDFSENSNLDLTSLLCPDDRKRGLVLANLKSIYHQAQLDVDSNELPDYLPMVLEFLSVADLDSSKEVLSIVGPGMEKLWEQLKNIASPYAGLLEACLVSTTSMRCSQIPATGGVS
ncbi:nitrate reductase molybdenum cofactor assembly chaperone [Pelosinus sp. sgz500959]|uniref:nitrate reductase molybdenum cofactor assembly chaperone n=1 Tax=Pelosinus sp. sgz500959 TaxID=3242472 RepID=UPI00366B64BE